MKKGNIKLISILLIVVTISIAVKSALILKTIFDIPAQEAISGFDKVMLIFGLLTVVIINIVFGIIIFSLSTKDKNEEADIQPEKQGILKRRDKNLKSKQSRQESLKEKQKQRNEILKKLNENISNLSNITDYTERVLSNIAGEYDVMQGIFFVKDSSDQLFKKRGSYAFYSEDDLKEFAENMGLSGQVAASKKLLNISNIPDKYITVLSGLGQSSPGNLLILPIVYKGESIGIVELASFQKFDPTVEEILMNFFAQIAEKLFELSNNNQ